MDEKKITGIAIVIMLAFVGRSRSVLPLTEPGYMGKWPPPTVMWNLKQRIEQTTNNYLWLSEILQIRNRLYKDRPQFPILVDDIGIYHSNCIH